MISVAKAKNTSLYKQSLVVLGDVESFLVEDPFVVNRIIAAAVGME